MANGIPFVFKSFKLDGRLASMDGLGNLLDAGNRGADAARTSPHGTRRMSAHWCST